MHILLIFCVKVLLDVLGYLSLYFVRGESLLGYSEGLFHHLALHVDNFESLLGEGQLVDRPTTHL